MAADSRKTLLVQGWTGINHSYAMVNQYQLLALAAANEVDLLTQEMPLYDTRWSREKNAAGFDAQEQSRLAALHSHAGQAVDAIYRIHSPNTLAPAEAKVITFMVTELGLDAQSLAPGADVQRYGAEGNLVVTPSHWSRERLVDFGFDPERVLVVPHGVDTAKFSPYSKQERAQARAALGYTDDDVVFLNVGAPIWNKGMDLVIESFFRLRQSNSQARLLIKDQQALYGLSALHMIRNLSDSGRISLDNASVESIRVLPQTLDIAQLRGLYNVADFYLSPYRAEGFNLPVIEAIACGTKVIVTAGGSTDDFCNPYTACTIPSQRISNSRVNDTAVGCYLQPDLDALVDILRRCAADPHAHADTLAFGRTDMLEQFTWKRAARLIAALV
jgi:glycosyltransferase involved in cell wall biosynthesis